MYSASAFAANTVVRSAIAAAFPLFTVQMFHKVCCLLPSPRGDADSLLIVGRELGGDLVRPPRSRPCTDALLILQVRSPRSGKESVRTGYREPVYSSIPLNCFSPPTGPTYSERDRSRGPGWTRFSIARLVLHPWGHRKGGISTSLRGMQKARGDVDTVIIAEILQYNVHSYL